MLDTTIAASNGAEPASAAGREQVFTYCCECGTYDAHARRCAFCGFDFTAETAIGEDVIE